MAKQARKQLQSTTCNVCILLNKFNVKASVLGILATVQHVRVIALEMLNSHSMLCGYELESDLKIKDIITFVPHLIE